MTDLIVNHWQCGTFFVLGFLLGIIFERLVLRKIGLIPDRLPRGLVSLIIVALWAISMSVDIYNGDSNTPFVLHAFMGSIVGAMNHEFGDFLLRFLGKK